MKEFVKILPGIFFIITGLIYLRIAFISGNFFPFNIPLCVLFILLGYLEIKYNDL